MQDIFVQPNDHALLRSKQLTSYLAKKDLSLEDEFEKLDS